MASDGEVPEEISKRGWLSLEKQAGKREERTLPVQGGLRPGETGARGADEADQGEETGLGRDFGDHSGAQESRVIIIIKRTSCSPAPLSQFLTACLPASAPLLSLVALCSTRATGGGCC